MSVSEEEWCDVYGFEGLYLINKKGDVYSTHYKRLLKPIFDKDGYVKCTLTKEGKPHYLRVHRLVVENFIPNPKNKPSVNHLNGIKWDNRLENLEWCTTSENASHAYNTGLSEKSRIAASMTHGYRHHLIHKVTGEVLNFNSLKQASSFLGKYDGYLKDKLRRRTLTEISKDLDYVICKGEYSK